MLKTIVQLPKVRRGIMSESVYGIAAIGEVPKAAFVTIYFRFSQEAKKARVFLLQSDL